MTTVRTIPDDVRRSLQQAASPDAVLALLTISHPNLVPPVYLVSDVFDYFIGGITYTAVMFDWVMLTDKDTPPETIFTIANIDRRIGLALEKINLRAQLKMQLVSSMDFNLNQNPRLTLGSPPRILYEFQGLELFDLKVNAASANFRVARPDMSQEPYPYHRVIAPWFPGMFR